MEGFQDYGKSILQSTIKDENKLKLEKIGLEMVAAKTETAKTCMFVRFLVFYLKIPAGKESSFGISQQASFLFLYGVMKKKTPRNYSKLD